MQVDRLTAANVIGVQEIVWDSYYDMLGHFVQQWQTGGLPTVREPAPDASKTTAIIAGKEVKRQPYIDDFADMMRSEDVDNHTRLERYINPLGPNSGMVYTTFILYGIPILTFVGVLTEVTGLLGRSS